MRGLPFTATLEEVQEFFDGIEIMNGMDGIVLTATSDGRPTGEAYVEFPSEEGHREAMKLHKKSMGSRYIELFNSNKGDMVQAMQQKKYYAAQSSGTSATAGGAPAPAPPGPIKTPIAGGSGRKRGGYAAAVAATPTSGPASHVNGSTLKLRGLPYSAGIEEITGFFEGFSLVDDGVQVRLCLQSVGHE